MRRKFMKKRCFICLLVCTLVLSSCGTSDNQGNSVDASKSTEIVTNMEDTEVSTGDGVSGLEAIGDIEVDENLFSVELTIPAEYVGETTQEELDATAKEKGFKLAALNEDGSATYIMTKVQHQEMMDEITISINESLAELIGSEEYPSFTNIEANEDFSVFTITTTSTELDLTESFSVVMFYMYGGMYNIFNGTPVDNVHVDFVNTETGEVISSADSSDTE